MIRVERSERAKRVINNDRPLTTQLAPNQPQETDGNGNAWEGANPLDIASHMFANDGLRNSRIRPDKTPPVP